MVIRAKDGVGEVCRASSCHGTCEEVSLGGDSGQGLSEVRPHSMQIPGRKAVRAEGSQHVHGP